MPRRRDLRPPKGLVGSRYVLPPHCPPLPKNLKFGFLWLIVSFFAIAQAHPNSITFLNYADAYDSGFPWMDMYNKAGTLVTPSTASVQSAMADYLDEYSHNNFTVDIYDANGTNSWPLSYMTFFSMRRNITVFDCTNIQELLQFIAWVHTNDECVALPPLHLALDVCSRETTAHNHSPVASSECRRPPSESTWPRLT